MNNFRKLIALVLALVCVMALAACAPADTNTTASKNPPATTNKPTATPTTQPTEPTEPQKEISFRVRVVDQDGNPVTGVWVQVCSDKMCFAAKLVDDDGYAVWYADKVPYQEGCHYFPAFFDSDDLAAKYEPLPDVEDESKWYFFEAGSNEGTIVLTKK